MTQPVVVDLPHSLGAAEAKRRISANVGSLADHIPGAANVQHSWSGDRLNLSIAAMGQAIEGHIDVQEKIVRIEMILPPMLAMFSGAITSFLSNKGGELLEDHSKQ